MRPRQSAQVIGVELGATHTGRENDRALEAIIPRTQISIALQATDHYFLLLMRSLAKD